MATRRPAKPKAEAKPMRIERDRLVTGDEARQLLGGISVDQLKGLRDRREIDYVPMASGARYWLSSLNEWLEARTVRAGDIPRP